EAAVGTRAAGAPAGAAPALEAASGGERAPAAAAHETPPSAPAARRLAEEQGLDLAEVRGQGRGGRVTVEDVRDHLEATRAGDGGRERRGEGETARRGEDAAAP